jgi:choice-of-anchor A domain-containing protein
VGRNITRFKHGGIWDDGGRKGYGVFANGKANTFVQLDLRKADLPLDFEAETNWLTMLSARLAAKPATGSGSLQANVLTLRGSNAAMEVFSLTAAQVGPNMTVKLVNVKADAWLVFNVRADARRQVTFTWNQEALRPYQPRVLFNFADTDVLKFDGARVWGTILAPFACARSSGGRVDGTVIVATWSGQTDIGHAPFVAGP